MRPAPRTPGDQQSEGFGAVESIDDLARDVLLVTEQPLAPLARNNDRGGRSWGHHGRRRDHGGRLDNRRGLGNDHGHRPDQGLQLHDAEAGVDHPVTGRQNRGGALGD